MFRTLIRTSPLLICLLARPLLAADIYGLHFSARFDPGAGRVQAAIEVSQSGQTVRVIDLAAPEPRFTAFRGDGSIVRDGKRLIWTVPADGGRLEYTVRVDHRRGDRFDARQLPDWALLRAGDLFPPARTLARRGAESQATLSLTGPAGWSFESRYGPVHPSVSVANPERRFDRPTGWLVAGRLGVRRERIADRRVTVAAPQGEDLRRLDIIAFLRWTLPTLVRVLPAFPERVLIVGARDGMWRGALSGPDSLYIHSERPLISENGTSTLLHELVHVATGSVRGPRDDWIVEGLAEFYGLEILRRSGGLGTARYRQAFDQLTDWARREHGRLTSPSTGADTARATLLFRDLNEELVERDAGGLDPVARRLLASRAIDTDTLRELVRGALDGPSETLQDALD